MSMKRKKMYAALDGMVKKDAISPPTRHRFDYELLNLPKRPDVSSDCTFSIRAAHEAGGSRAQIATASDVYDTAYEFARKLGKVPVRTSDKTGFIVKPPARNPICSTPSALTEEGVGSIDDIDNAMKLGCATPWGRSRCWTLSPRYDLLHSPT